MINLEKEKERMKEILDNMTNEEFEQMLINRGINEILPSEQSNYVKALKGNFEK